MSFITSAVDVRLKSVLIASDFSSTSNKPLHHALAIAHYYGAKLYVVHVVSPPGYLIAGAETIQAETDRASREAQRLERELSDKGLLNALDHEFIVRQGRVGEELQTIISQKGIDLVVLGTHGRHGIEKLFLGSVAEQVFRHTNCLVLTVGPLSYQECRVGLSCPTPNFLFATDFGDASLQALPYAISLANQSRAKLIFLHVISAASSPDGSGWYTAADAVLMRENARMAVMRQLEQLVPRDEEAPLETEFMVQFGFPSEKILQVALERGVDLIVMGLHASTHIGTVSHLPWATAYEVVCGAGCPVLTVR
jgi:nucleotide-binding universal stress UspA family protein